MLRVLRESENDKYGHRMVEVECSWCFGREAVRAANAVIQDSCGCRKRGTRYVLAQRQKNLWSKYADSKLGPAMICKQILSDRATMD